MGSALNVKEQDNGLRQEQHEESTATRNHAPGTDRLARRGTRGWTRIGAAWEHEDGEGLTLHYDLLPAAGAPIVLRKPKEDDQA
jgi:hypothetical protein